VRRSRKSPQRGVLFHALFEHGSVFASLLGCIVLVNSLDGCSPLPKGEVVNLGTARFPSDAGVDGSGVRAEVATHEWRRPRERARYQLDYAHGAAQATTIADRHIALARRFRYEEAEDDTFRWRIPDDCRTGPWECIYAQVLEDNADSLAPLIDRFETRFRDEGWSTLEATHWLLAFVQQIPYRIPKEFAFGILPPSIVASRDWGDCDSKSLLLVALLDRFGIESVLLMSEAHAHAMVGVSVPAGRKPFRDRGRDFAWAETTAEVPLGHLHPSLRTPDDWQVVLRR
jgi:hypothetical protein